jgi:hypothetical protein
MDIKVPILGLALTALLGVGGCASPVTKWDHASANADQWAIDKAGCRSRARRLTEKEYAPEKRNSSLRDDEFMSGYANNMRIFDTGRSKQRHYETCLKRLGYTPAKSAE